MEFFFCAEIGVDIVAITISVFYVLYYAFINLCFFSIFYRFYQFVFLCTILCFSIFLLIFIETKYMQGYARE